MRVRPAYAEALVGDAKTIALSSGEAELAGIVKGAAEGLGVVAVAQDLGLMARLLVCSDSSAISP
eukprot:10080134-Alexandrium_andersonii.AAC.1